MSEENKEQIKKPITKRVTGTTREVAAQILNLATSSFGLVAALAWNDAIQAIFKQYIPSAGGGIVAKLIYAVLVSALIVLITINLTKLAQIAKNK